MVQQPKKAATQTNTPKMINWMYELGSIWVQGLQLFLKEAISNLSKKIFQQDGPSQF